MAEGLNEPTQIVKSTDDAALDAPRGAVGRSREHAPLREAFPHAGKFRAALGLLVGLGIGALAVAAVVLIGHKKSGPSVPWSSWRPPDSGTLGAREIADHVAPLYRISGTDQLAVVTVVSLGSSAAAQAAAQNGTSNSASSGLQIAVKTDPSSSALSLLTGNTIAYNLCGIGSSNCSIGVGTPSTARLLLLKHEALELALYTFRYISGTDNVVAILPPGHTVTGCTGICSKPNEHTVTKSATFALLFLHDELTPWLGVPLGETLPQIPPSVSQINNAPEAPLVEQITARGLFYENVEQAQDGTNVIVLTPQPPS